MRKLAIGLVGSVVLLLGACFLLPERFVFNAPAANLLFGTMVDSPPESALDRRIHSPEGFSLSFYAVDVPNARFLRFTASGDLLVSQPRRGQLKIGKGAKRPPQQVAVVPA